VKKFESGMVVNPLTIQPGATLADALELMKAHRISGVPVVEGGGNGKAGKLVGIPPIATCASPPTPARGSPT
jgi:IMP dehydrogenase